MVGFEIYGKHLYKDFNCYIDEADTSPPAPNQVLVEIPFMQGAYDFTNAFSETTYPNRTLKYYVDVIGESSKDLTLKKILLENWLLGGKEDVLTDDRLIGYYYVAKCTEIKENDEKEYTRLEITFDAYPFKIKNCFEGNTYWDSFCFLTDYMQQTSFNVNGDLKIILNNYGNRKANPTIIASSDMKIKKGNVTYNFKKGTTTDYRFQLEKGENPLIISGNGSIEFRFRIGVL